MKNKTNNAKTTEEKNKRYNTDTPELKKDILNRILNELGKLGISNKKLADAVGVDAVQVCMWFKRATITLKLLQVLHNKFGFDLNYIICGDSSTTNKEKKEKFEKLCKDFNSAYKKLLDHINKM